MGFLDDVGAVELEHRATERATVLAPVLVGVVAEQVDDSQDVVRRAGQNDRVAISGDAVVLESVLGLASFEIGEGEGEREGGDSVRHGFVVVAVRVGL